MQMNKMPGKIKEAVTSWRVSHQWRLNSHSDLFSYRKCVHPMFAWQEKR